jgi:hypothetical protein
MSAGHQVPDEVAVVPGRLVRWVDELDSAADDDPPRGA